MDELFRGDKSPFCAPFADDARAFRNSTLAQCAEPAVATEQSAAPVQWTADAGNPAMAEFDQVFGADAGTVFVIGCLDTRRDLPPIVIANRLSIWFLFPP